MNVEANARYPSSAPTRISIGFVTGFDAGNASDKSLGEQENVRP